MQRDQTGFWPDTVSTIGPRIRAIIGRYRLPERHVEIHSCSACLGQVIARATVNAARVFPTFDDRGTPTLARRPT